MKTGHKEEMSMYTSGTESPRDPMTVLMGKMDYSVKTVTEMSSKVDNFEIR